MRPWARLLTTVVLKDLRLELRTRRSLFLAVVFAMLVTVAFAFAFGRTVGTTAAVGRAALWVAFLFAGVVLVTRTAGLEGADQAIEGLLLAPADRTAIFLGKTVANAIFLLVLHVVTLGFVVVFLSFPVGSVDAGMLGSAFVVTAGGYAAAGTLLSTLAIRSRLPELTVPLVLVPVVVPILLVGLSLTRAATAGGQGLSWLQIGATYDGILLLAGVALFEPLVES